MKLKFLYLLLILIFLIPNVFGEFLEISINPKGKNIELIMTVDNVEDLIYLCHIIRQIGDFGTFCLYTYEEYKPHFSIYHQLGQLQTKYPNAAIDYIYISSDNLENEVINNITEIYGEELGKIFKDIVYPIFHLNRNSKIDGNFSIVIKLINDKYKVMNGYLKVRKEFVDVSKLISFDIDKRIKLYGAYFDLKNGRIKTKKDGKIIIEWSKNGEKAKIELTNLEGDFYFVPKDNEVWWEKETTKRFLFWEIKNENKKLSEEVKDILGKIGFEKDSEIEIIYEKNKQKYVYEIKGNEDSGLFLTEIPYLCPHKEIEIVSVSDNKITRIGERRCYDLDTSKVIAFDEKNIIPEFTKINNNPYYNLAMFVRFNPGMINGIEIRDDSLRLNRVTIYKFGPFNILKK